jgi:hypothetical protein
MRIAAFTLSLVIITVFTASLGTAASDSKVSEFIAAAESHLKPGEALDALRAGPPEEYFRWGEGICEHLRGGWTPKQLIEGNLDQFFGPELSVALVLAAQQVICPDQRQ